MTRPLQPCGTYAAYRRHLKHRETTCAPCREALRMYERMRVPRRRGSGRQAWLDECWCCGNSGLHHGRGLCGRCYARWCWRGFTGPGPGPEFVPQAERAREYAHVITSLSARRAAEKLGVSSRTVTRYRAALREAS